MNKKIKNEYLHYTTYTCSRVVISYEGDTLNAIKMVQKYSAWTSKLIYYYADGYGLMDTEFQSETGEIKKFERFYKLSFEIPDIENLK